MLHFTCRTSSLVFWKDHDCSQMGFSSAEQPLNRNHLQCNECDLGFNRRADYSAHCLTHRQRYQCDQCIYTCERAHQLETHMNIHNNDLCPYSPVDEKTMRAHRESGFKPYHCALCTLTSVNVNEVYEHLRFMHRISDVRIIKANAISVRRLGENNTQRLLEFPSPDKPSVQLISTALPGKDEGFIGGHCAVSPLMQTDPMSDSPPNSHTLQTANVESIASESSSEQSGGRMLNTTGPQACTPDGMSREMTMFPLPTMSGAKAEVSRGMPSHETCFTEKLSELVSNYTPKIPELDYSKFRTPPDGRGSDVKLGTRDFLISSTAKVGGKTIPKYKCKVCYMEMYNRPDMRNHITLSHLNDPAQAEYLSNLKPNTKYYCQHCTYVTTATTNLRSHYSTSHAQASIDFTKFAVPDLANKKKHSKQYSCKLCPFNTIVTTNLRRHYVRHHGGITPSLGTRNEVKNITMAQQATHPTITL